MAIHHLIICHPSICHPTICHIITTNAIPILPLSILIFTILTFTILTFGILQLPLSISQYPPLAISFYSVHWTVLFINDGGCVQIAIGEDNYPTDHSAGRDAFLTLSLSCSSHPLLCSSYSPLSFLPPSDGTGGPAATINLKKMQKQPLIFSGY